MDSSASWGDVGDTAESISRAGREIEQRARRRVSSAADKEAARQALLALTAAGARLARQLDTLAARYESTSVAEPSATQVALDQAAAAAEDLGLSTRVAAQAIEEGE
ncbi:MULTISPECIES: hypothetical protein [Saccharopolyspora]|uniref:Chemotaxis protein n=1 Tax=Saccharopolyspora cebuensis TaxID=418759 RepID=A0ABV4CEQ7_9PSEU